MAIEKSCKEAEASNAQLVDKKTHKEGKISNVKLVFFIMHYPV